MTTPSTINDKTDNVVPQSIVDKITSNPQEIIDLLKDLNFESSTPDYLYHYRKVDRSIQEIQTGSIFLCPTDRFDDPYDSLIPIKKIIDNGRAYKQAIEMGEGALTSIADIFNDENDSVDDAATKIESDNAIPTAIDSLDDDFDDLNLSDIYENFIDLYKGLIHTCCLSETCESFAMWDRYADGYKGICIKYDMNKMNKLLTNSFFKVNYSSELFDCNKKIGDDTIQLLLTILGCILTKNTDYSYEKEWRYFSIALGDEYLDVEETIDCVYIGTDCNTKDCKDIVKLCHSKNIPVVKMKIKSDSFGFDYIPIKNNLID